MMNMSKPMAAPQLNPVPGSSSISTTASVSVHQPPSNGYPSLIYVIGEIEFLIFNHIPHLAIFVSKIGSSS